MQKYRTVSGESQWTLANKSFQYVALLALCCCKVVWRLMSTAEVSIYWFAYHFASFHIA
jgi:hypothetical protein